MDPPEGFAELRELDLPDLRNTASELCPSHNRERAENTERVRGVIYPGLVQTKHAFGGERASEAKARASDAGCERAITSVRVTLVPDRSGPIARRPPPD